MGNNNPIWLDEKMHHWIRFTANRGPEFSAEAEEKLDKLVGNDGIVIILAEVERVEIDDEDNKVFMVYFIHPFEVGEVQGYRIMSDEFENRDRSDFNSKCLQLKQGDLVLLSGSSVQCNFGLWFFEKAYQISLRKDKYYNLYMDLLDIQKILNIDDRKNYTINSEGRFVTANHQNLNQSSLKEKWLYELKELAIGMTIAGMIIFICHILGIDLG